MNARLLFVACLGLSAVVQAGEVYKWVGPDGRTHFGDRPPDASAQRLNIRSFDGTSDVTTTQESSGNNIVMLSTTWCGVCTRARAYLTSKGIAFTELDVEKSAAGKAEYQRLNGRGVPIILVGNQQMTGFNPDRLEQMLKGE